MDRYKLVPKLSATIALGLGVILAKFANDWAMEQKLHVGATLLLMLVAVKLGSVMVEASLEWLFQSVRWIRRLLLANTFVEGTWIELVRSDGQPFSVSITHLSPQGFGLTLTGVNYSVDGIQKSNFRADMAEIHWPRIDCKHSNQPAEGTMARLEGYGELQFAVTGSTPISYSGFFMHLTEGKRYNVQAYKLGEAELERLNTAERRIELIRDFAKQFNLPQDLH